jgi:polysaccharide export outer membrane protein
MQSLIKLVAVLVLSVLGGCAIAPIDASEPHQAQNKKEPVIGESIASGDSVTTQTTLRAPATGTPSKAAASQLIDQYKIGVDDVVQVSVWRNPELSVTVPVRPDGKISVPLIGDVQAGGRTPRQVAASVQKKLSHYVRDPRVAIILTQLKSHEYLSRIRVTGAVKTPTSIPYRQGMTVLDVVLAAGGVSEFAAPNRARVYRKHNGRTKSLKVRLGDILNKGKLDTNFDLEPGDVITVPERLF